MDEARIVLESIHERLGSEPSEMVGAMSLSSSELTLWDEQVRIKVEVHHDPGMHPAIAHCHVLAELGTHPGVLDACIVGIHTDRKEALAQAGVNWVGQVAEAMLSLLHATPVMSATHFDGTQQEGVQGCHGFLGPMIGRAVKEDFDLSPMLDRPLFDGVEALAPPGVLHLAKVTLTAAGPEGWNRSVEVDGHLATFADVFPSGDAPVPEEGILSRFAVFHFADQPEWIEQRQRSDDAIRQFMNAFEGEGDFDGAVKALEESNVSEDLIHGIINVVPIAVGRYALSGSEVSFSPTYFPVHADGTLGEETSLIRNAFFARGTILGRGAAEETIRKLAVTSPEIIALNQALHKGEKLEDLRMAPPLIPDPDADSEAIASAIRELRQRRE